MRNTVSDPTPWDQEVPSSPRSEPGLFRTAGYPWLWLIAGVFAAGYGVTLATRSALWGEIVVGGRALDYIWFAEYGGLMVGYLLAYLVSDRRSKKGLAASAQGVMLLLGLAGAAFSVIGQLGFGGFVVLAICSGLAHGLFVAVLLGWLGDLLPRRLLAKGVVVLSLADISLSTLSTAIPPLVGTGSQAITGYFIGGSLLFLLALGLTWRVAPSSLQMAEQLPTAVYLKAGVRYITGDLRLRTLWIYGLVVGASIVALYIVLTRYHFGILGSDTSDFVPYWIAHAGAGLVATIALIFLIGISRIWILLLACAALLGLSSAALAFATGQAMLMIFMIANGLVIYVAPLTVEALLLSSVRSGYFGRVAALVVFSGSLFSFVSPLLSGVVDSWLMERWIIVAIGVLLVIAAYWLYRQWRKFRDWPSDPDQAERLTAMRFIADFAAPQKPVTSR